MKDLTLRELIRKSYNFDKLFFQKELIMKREIFWRNV